MALPQGVNFRATSGYVADGTNYDHDLLNGTGTADYPITSAQGNNIGWETGGGTYQSRDRNSGNDARLAGITFQNSNTDITFRVDLPSTGNYKIGLAAGDANYAAPVPVDLYDTLSNLASLSTGSTSGSNHFKDATNTDYSAASWPGSQTIVQYTFATTICRWTLIGNGSTSRISSIYVEAGAGAAAVTYPKLERGIRGYCRGLAGMN